MKSRWSVEIPRSPSPNLALANTIAIISISPHSPRTLSMILSFPLFSLLPPPHSLLLLLTSISSITTTTTVVSILMVIQPTGSPITILLPRASSLHAIPYSSTFIAEFSGADASDMPAPGDSLYYRATAWTATPVPFLDQRVKFGIRHSRPRRAIL